MYGTGEGERSVGLGRVVGSCRVTYTVEKGRPDFRTPPSPSQE